MQLPKEEENREPGGEIAQQNATMPENVAHCCRKQALQVT